MARDPLPRHRFARHAACTAALLASLACAAPVAMAGSDRSFSLRKKCKNPAIF